LSARILQNLIKVELPADFREARHEYLLRRQPARPVRLVVGENRARVQRIVEIKTDRHASCAEHESLRHAKIELVDAVSIQRSRVNDVDRRIGRASRKIPAE
jgi:hypothetical protein